MLHILALSSLVLRGSEVRVLAIDTTGWTLRVSLDRDGDASPRVGLVATLVTTLIATLVALALVAERSVSHECLASGLDLGLGGQGE
jgi:hypothetical protein